MYPFQVQCSPCHPIVGPTRNVRDKLLPSLFNRLHMIRVEPLRCEPVCSWRIAFIVRPVVEEPKVQLEIIATTVCPLHVAECPRLAFPEGALGKPKEG